LEYAEKIPLTLIFSPFERLRAVSEVEPPKRRGKDWVIV